MRRTATTLAVLLTAGTLAACGKDEDDDTPAPASQTTAPATPVPAAAPPGCEPATPVVKEDEVRQAPEDPLDPGTYTAVLETNCGTIRIRLATDRSPQTTASFAALVRDGFYDGLTFHRVAVSPTGTPFVIQGGDPLGTGPGGPGYSVVEPPPDDTQYTRGVVAMAKNAIEDPGASGSQFFIVTGDENQLPPEYAVLGSVVGGEETVDRIAAVPTDPATEMPTAPVVIEQVRISEG